MVIREIVGAVVSSLCFLLGGILLANALAFRLRDRRVTGIAAGVRKVDGDLHPLYRYPDARDDSVEVVSGSSTEHPEDRSRGTSVTLLALANPHRAEDEDGYRLELRGLAYIGMGLVGLHGFLQRWPLALVLLIAALGAFAVWVHPWWGVAGSPAASPGPAPVRDTGSHDAAAQEDETSLDSAPIQTRRRSRLAAVLSAAVAVAIAVAFIILPALEAGNILYLQRAGLRTQGTVIRIDAPRDGDGDIQHPLIVRFNTTRDASVEFEETSDSPGRQVGAIVPVLYLPAHPQTARIDIGIGDLLMRDVLTAAVVMGGWLVLTRITQEMIEGLLYALWNWRRSRTGRPDG
jgi:hypothetical protein